MPEIPDGAKRPEDHKSAQAEALDPNAPIVFTYDDVDYEIDPDFRDDLEIIEDLQEGRELSAVQRILGAEQWRAWKEANRGANGRVKATVAQPFLEQLFKELKAGN